MSWVEERTAAEATLGLRDYDPSLVVFWNDVLLRYVVAQDVRVAISIMPEKERPTNRVYRKIESEKDLLGCAQLKREYPNGMIPFQSGFILDWKGKSVYPDPGMIIYAANELFPYQFELEEKKIFEKSEQSRQVKLAKSWNDEFGADTMAKDIAKAKRRRRTIDMQR